MLIEGAEEKREMGEFCMVMRGEDEIRSEERFQGNPVAELYVCACVHVCVIGGLVLLCQGNA